VLILTAPLLVDSCLLSIVLYIIIQCVVLWAWQCKRWCHKSI